MKTVLLLERLLPSVLTTTNTDHQRKRYVNWGVHRQWLYPSHQRVQIMRTVLYVKDLVVPPGRKTRVFVHQNILIPAGSRCCPVHIKDHTFTDENISILKSTYDESLLNRTTIVDMLQRMRDICKRHEKTRLDFDSRHTLNDADYIALTGLSLSAFDEVLSIIKDSVKNTPVRSQRCSVAIFFCILYILVEVSIHISTTWWVSLLVDKGAPEGTCSQVLRSTSVDL